MSESVIRRVGYFWGSQPPLAPVKHPPNVPEAPCPTHPAGHSYGWDASADACVWCASPRPVPSWRRTRRLIRSIVRGLS